MKKRIAFMGAGAIGGYVGGQLSRNGHDVTLIDPWPAHIEAIRANGLEMTGTTAAERCIVKPNTMHLTDAQSLSKQKPIDIAFICMKSYDTEWATAMIRQYLAPDGFIVSLPLGRALRPPASVSARSRRCAAGTGIVPEYR